MEPRQALLQRILRAYEAEGFPAEVIGSWAISHNDIADFLDFVQDRRPRRMLEVGTFVGLSTMLAAVAGGPGLEIVSVDPNLPLAVEMTTTGSSVAGIDASRTAQAVAAAVAARLGVADRVRLVAGGFSCGASFASRLAGEQRELPVVGPATCAAHGPFDLAFIDGLHYADVVAGDLALVAQHMAPDGVILLHDCVGLWATNVRAGAFRFLADNPEWRLLQPPYGLLYRTLGVLFRPASEPALAARLLAAPRLTALKAGQLQHIVTALLQQTGAARVLELTQGASLLEGHVAPALLGPALDLASSDAELAARLAAEPGLPLVVAPGLLDMLDDPAVTRLFAAVARAGAALVMLRTPPGEEGAAVVNSRPLRRWMRLATLAGARLFELPALDFGPDRFGFGAAFETAEAPSSLCGLSLLATPGTVARFAQAERLLPLGSARVDVAEQDELHAAYQHAGFARMQAYWRNAPPPPPPPDPALLAQMDDQRRLLDWFVTARAERPGWRERLARLRRLPRLLPLRIIDTDAETLIELALRDAWGRGETRPCLMLSWEAEPALIERLLADSRVGSVGSKQDWNAAAPASLGRYFHDGSWTLPNPRRVVYFLGPWRLMTLRMLAHAARAGVEEINFRLGSDWCRLRPQQLYRFAAGLRHARWLRHRLREHLRDRQRRLPDAAAEALTRGRLSEEAAFAALVAAAPPPGPARPGRVVLVCGNLAPGGAERQAANTVIGLHRRGLDAMLLAHFLDDGAARHGFHLPRVLAAGAAAREIRRRLPNPEAPEMPAALAALAGSLPDELLTDIGNMVLEFQELRPEVVHAWLDWDNVRAGLAAVLAGVPKVVVSGRNLNPSHFRLHLPYMLPAYRALAQAPQVRFINNSRAGADDYADWIGMPRERIGVIANGVTFGQGRPPPEAIAAARAALGLPQGAFVVGGVFRLAEEKRPLLWLDAAARIAAAAPEARFVIHGQGPLLRVLQTRCARADLAGRVILAGVTSDPLTAMAACDLVLLTSYGEGLPNVLLEAQSVGTPVVTTDAGGAREALQPGVTGWVATDDQPAAIAALVLALRDDPSRLAAAAAAGPGFVRAHFGVERMLDATVALYGLPATAEARDAAAA